MSFDAANDSVLRRLEGYYNQYSRLYLKRKYAHLIYRNFTRAFSNPLCDYIKSYEGPADEMEEACQLLITRIVSKHQTREGKCRHSKVHNDLYVAIRIAFSAQLSDSKTVGNLLQEIFACNKNFLKIFEGVFTDHDGSEGDDPLFRDRDESLEAVDYFLHQACKEKLVFSCDGIPKRMMDIPMGDVFCQLPVAFALKTNNVKLFMLLVQYGANCFEKTFKIQDVEGADNPSVKELLDIIEKRKFYTPEIKVCKAIFLRANIFEKKEFPSLQEILKMVIRKHLYDNHQLPHVIKELNLPMTLQSYLNLEY